MVSAVYKKTFANILLTGDENTGKSSMMKVLNDPISYFRDDYSSCNGITFLKNELKPKSAPRGEEPVKFV